MSSPQKEGGPTSEPSQAHSGIETKKEPTEENGRVPREEARATRDCTPQPPTWDEDIFQGGRGIVEEKGDIAEGESDNMARRLKEFLERSGRNQTIDIDAEDDRDDYDRRFEEETKDIFFVEEEKEESKPAEAAEGEGKEEQPDEPKTKMPRTEATSIPLAKGI
eukprot:6214355-Amphidinium_carterae.1